jgi:hypothetical protein
MKKLLWAAGAAIFSLATVASASAQTPFFLNKTGAVAEYQVKGPDGSVISIARSTVTAIDAIDDRNFTVSYNIEAFDANHNALTPAMPMTTMVKNGTVEIAPNSMGMEVSGTVPSYPADMSVGYTQEYNFTLKMMGVDAVTSGKEKVVSRESVTTAAGTFNCFKIESSVTVKAMGQTQNINTVSWITAGVGTVRQETRDGAGNLQMVQELVSLK